MVLSIIVRALRRYISFFLLAMIVLIVYFSIEGQNYDTKTELIILLSVVIPSHFIISFLVNYWSFKDRGIKYVSWITFDTILVLGITSALYYTTDAILKTTDRPENIKQVILISVSTVCYSSLAIISHYLIAPIFLTNPS